MKAVFIITMVAGLTGCAGLDLERAAYEAGRDAACVSDSRNTVTSGQSRAECHAGNRPGPTYDEYRRARDEELTD